MKKEVKHIETFLPFSYAIYNERFDQGKRVHLWYNKFHGNQIRREQIT